MSTYQHPTRIAYSYTKEDGTEVATTDTGVQITTRMRQLGDRKGVRKGRVYGALNALVPELMAEEPHTDYAIPAKPETDEDVQKAAEWTAWKRRTLKAARARLLPILALIAGGEVDPKNVRFSTTAGCSCPCSPGFIVKDDRFARTDIYVNN